MRAFYLSLILMLIHSFVIGQEQIDALIKKEKGIDPTKTNLMYEYRLPDWGYDNLYFDLSGNFYGSHRSGDNLTGDYIYKNFRFSPYYNHYFESEKNIIEFQSSIQSSLTGTINETDRKSSYSKSDHSHTDVSFEIFGNWHHYLKNQWYLRLSTEDAFSYFENETESTNTARITDKNGYIYREYRVALRLGPGYGHVRNITPVIRALRFNERMKDLSLGSGISDEDLKDLAAFFTKRESYLESYDRSNKYLYRQFPKGVLSKLEELSPWEVMYLHDAWSEIVGQRYEGFEINGGLAVNYEKNKYSKDITASNNMELSLLGLYFEHAYYHNPSYAYQVSLRSRGSFAKVMNDNSVYESIGSFSMNLSNLWNMTDKFLVNWGLGYHSDFFSGDIWERVDNVNTALSFQYFIENNLSFDTDLSYKYLFNWPEDVDVDLKDYYYYISNYQKEHAWQIVFNLRYYLKRGLF